MVSYGPWHSWIWIALWATEMNWCIPSLCLPPLPAPTHPAWWPHFIAAQESYLATAGYQVVESSLACCPNWNGWAFQEEGMFWDLGHWSLGLNWLWWQPQTNGVGGTGQEFSALLYKYLHNILVFVSWPPKPKIFATWPGSDLQNWARIVIN